MHSAAGAAKAIRRRRFQGLRCSGLGFQSLGYRVKGSRSSIYGLRVEGFLVGFEFRGVGFRLTSAF